MSVDVLDWLAANMPAWALPTLGFFTFGWYLLRRAAEVRADVAALVPWFGRRWHQAARLRASQDGTELLSEYGAIKVELDDVERRVKALEASNVIHEAYELYDAEWHQTAMIMLPGVKLPPHVNYAQFAAKWRTGWRPVDDVPVE